MDCHLTQTNKEKISTGLSTLLADSYTLYLKTQNYHWNVTGPRFAQLHSMFEEQYNDLADAVDTIAERIRALGFLAPATMSEYVKMTSIRERTGQLSENEMIKDLAIGHEEISRKIQEVLQYTMQFNDEASADLMIARQRVHDKTAWMLNSFSQ